MKNILCFGDSNTWGYNAESGARFDYSVRWTTNLQKSLGDDFNVIVEGLNGRTTVFEDLFSPYRNGSDYLPAALLSHAPLDAVVIMLGTNDSKNFFRNTAFTIGLGIGRLVEIIQASETGPGRKSPKILLISPVPVTSGRRDDAAFDLRAFENLDGHDPAAVSEGLAAEFQHKAGEYGCAFLDAADFAEVSPVDGVHLTAEGHKKLGPAVADKIRKMGI